MPGELADFLRQMYDEDRRPVQEAAVEPDLQDLVDEAARITMMAATLEDREFNLVAFGAHRTAGDVVRQDSILTRRSTPEVRRYYESFGIVGAAGPLRIPADPDRGLLSRICVPVRWQSVTYGYLWLIEDRGVAVAVGPALLPELLGLAARAGIEMARRSRLRDDLGWKLGDLLSTYPDTRALAARQIAESWSRPEATPVAAVVVRVAAAEPDLHAQAGFSAPAPAASPALVNAWRLPRTVLVGTGELGSTFLVPLNAPGDLAAARSVASAALATAATATATTDRAGGTRGEPRVVAGIGGPVSTLAEAQESWLQARIAARVAAGRFGAGSLEPASASTASTASSASTAAAAGSGVGSGFLEWPALGVYRLLGVADDQPLRGALFQPGIGRLIDQGGPALVHTALVYLDQAGSVQRTAQALGIHRQTLYHRLERIEKTTGLDLDSGTDRLALHLALTLLPRLGAR
jgi:PucR C-terminal helix-turn-helix domain/GGDEF-like domain